MDSGEEPTEMTAMTSGESGASSPDGASASLGIMTISHSNVMAPPHHRKPWYKRVSKSPHGKCILAVVMVTLLALGAYLLSKIIIGSLHMHSCPADPFIPIYLVVSAVLLISFILLLTISLVRCKRDESDDRVSPVHLVCFVYFFIHIVLQLAGSVCVIRTRNDVLNTEPVIEDTTQQAPAQQLPAGCDASLISFSFGVVIFELILSCLMFIVAVLSLCEVIYIVCCKVPNHTKQPTNR